MRSVDRGVTRGSTVTLVGRHSRAGDGFDDASIIDPADAVDEPEHMNRKGAKG